MVVAEALARRVELSMFTTILKLLVKLKSFKIFATLNEMRALGVFSNSAAASGIFIVAAARVQLRSASFQI